MKTLTYGQYMDKVMGCWIGKILGGSGGVAYEGVKQNIRNVDFKQILDASIPNDDFDLQIMWLHALEEKGPYLTTAYMEDLWEKSCRYPWSEYGYFMKNHKRGIKAPYSGWFNNDFFNNGMGSPIRSEIWAIAYPGMPDLAGKCALMDSSLDHSDNSMWGECFLARLESILFVENDLMVAIETALEGIDKNTRIYACISEIIRNLENGYDFDENLQFIYRNYSHPDFTNSTQNIGIALLGVLYGDADMDKTINTALSGGYDADCTCATAGSIIGILIGGGSIPEDLKKLINNHYVCGVDIKRRDNKITSFAEDSARLGVSMIRELKTDEIEITQIDSGVQFIHWDKPAASASIAVEYMDQPAIGVHDRCKVEAVISNGSNHSLKGSLKIRGLKTGWAARFDPKTYTIPAGEKISVEIIIETGDLKVIDQSNILTAVFCSGDGEESSVRFGIAGAVPFRLYGPFFDAPNWESDSSWPGNNVEQNLPSIVSMVHNEVILDKEYLDEQAIMSNPLEYTNTLIGTIAAKTDIIPIEDSVSISGECGFMLVCDVIFKEDTKAWVVIGNTDAFKIWLNGECCIRKDEHFLWTPINNAFIGNFRKGSNRLMFKILRRCDNVVFSVGIKDYNDKHYHQTFWIPDLSYEVIQ
ncbi:MAG: ADP-ribosylglycohydrolase family protein [Saccharofermentanales bacterium]